MLNTTATRRSSDRDRDRELADAVTSSLTLGPAEVTEPNRDGFAFPATVHGSLYASVRETLHQHGGDERDVDVDPRRDGDRRADDARDASVAATTTTTGVPGFPGFPVAWAGELRDPDEEEARRRRRRRRKKKGGTGKSVAKRVARRAVNHKRAVNVGSKIDQPRRSNTSEHKKKTKTNGVGSGDGGGVTGGLGKAARKTRRELAKKKRAEKKKMKKDVKDMQLSLARLKW